MLLPHRRTARRLAVALALTLPCVAGPGGVSTARAEPIKIHVRGTAVVQAFAAGEPGSFSIQGEVDDDAGMPIGHAPLVFSTPTKDGMTITSLEPCPGSRGTVRRGADAARSAAGFAVEASEVGAFCVSGKTSSPHGNVHVHFAGTKLHDPTDLDVAIDADKEQRIRTLLRFEPPPETIDLDRESATVTVSFRIERAEALRSASSTTKREGLTLTLEDERGTRLGEATTGGDGRARFEVKTASFGPPGSGELTVKFAGNETLSRASLTQPVLRRAEARLALAHPVAPADPDEGAVVEVAVATARGPIEGGVVEALHGTDSVGAASVEHGVARVVAAFPPRAESPMVLRLRLVPGAPYVKAGPELAAEVLIATPSPARQILLALVVLGVAVWVVAGWRRAPKAAFAPGREPAHAPPSGRAGVEVLAQPPGMTGWRGVVCDAHDGAPIPRAQLRIVTPAFQGDGVVAEVLTDDAGAFLLEVASGSREGARLVVESELHSSHEQALPPPSVLGIALVTRRRALLERLVRWARRHGAPFDALPEPTPGHVRRAAARADATAIAAWAARVEHAAYGPAPVDPAAEKEVRAAEPNAPGHDGGFAGQPGSRPQTPGP